MSNLQPEISNDPQITEAYHFPIVKAFADRIGLVDTINSLVPCNTKISPGHTILAMVIDTLSGRSPLYRLDDFFENQDTELLLGTKIDPSDFSDHNVGRILDRCFEAGPTKIYSQIVQNAIRGFSIDTSVGHYDTTSVSLSGNYEMASPLFKITYGHSKDKRHDLKQFMVSMLCVDRDIPIMGKTEDGNASDKKLNTTILAEVSAYMKKNGLPPEAFVYVADSAMVTSENLSKAEDNDIRFVTRLPSTYKECGRVISLAADTDKWTDIGVLAEVTPAERAARYKIFETEVTIDGKTMRAVVVHSSAHDKRRHKKIDRMIEKEFKDLEKSCKDASAKTWFCMADARVAASELEKTRSHLYVVRTDIKETVVFKKGRPSPGKERTPDRTEFTVSATIFQNEEKIDTLRFEAGSFVLITNLPEKEGEKSWDSEKILRLYKDQYGIERNFGFLKDPCIVNSILLKKPERIQVLGMVLIISLLIWRLIERTMRQNIKDSGKTITGWKKRQTERPTSFMLTTRFKHILVITSGNSRKLARPLTHSQLEFLHALGLGKEIYTSK